MLWEGSDGSHRDSQRSPGPWHTGKPAGDVSSPHPTNTTHCPNVGLMWPAVVDGGPTLDQHWVDVSWLLCTIQTTQPSKHKTFVQRRPSVEDVVQMLNK